MITSTSCRTLSLNCVFHSRALKVAYSNLIRAALLCVLIAIAAVPSAFAQGSPAHRDHLTEQEGELIRAAQRIDLRTAIFIKAVDRRLLALAVLTGNAAPAANAKAVAKDAEKYGALPTSTAAELLADIERILDEAITNIDDASEKKLQAEFLPKTLAKLSQAATRYLAQLAPMRLTLKDEPARLILERAIENAESIVDAAKSSGNA